MTDPISRARDEAEAFAAKTDRPVDQDTSRTLLVQTTTKTVALRYSPQPVKWIIPTKEQAQ